MTTASLQQQPQDAQFAGVTPPQSFAGLIWRVILATLAAWAVSRILNHGLMGESLIPDANFDGVSQFQYLSMTMVSSFLIAAAMSYAATLSSLRGMALVQVLAVTHFGLNSLLALVEASVFLTEMSAEQVGLGIFSGAIDAIILALCITLALGKSRAAIDGHSRNLPGEPMSPWEWIWKLALCSVAYVFLYIVAGMLILPLVREYYPDLDPEAIDPLFLIALQVRRGAFYVLCVVPLIRSMRASRVRIALTIAVLVPIVHGVAGLLVPNEHMTAAAWRYAHMAEIGWSNFVFGALIGFLFSRGVPSSVGSTASEPA